MRGGTRIRMWCAITVASALLCAGAGGAAQREGGPARCRVHPTADGWAGRFEYRFVTGQLFEWNTDPTAVPGLLGEVTRRTGVENSIRVGTIALDSPRLTENPFVIMTGNRVFRFSDAEVENLRRYLRGGGFIYADDCGGSDFSFRRELRRIVPGAELRELPADHPLFGCFYELKNVPKIVDLYRGPARAYGLELDGRLAVVYTYDTDIPCAWEVYPDGSYVHVIPDARREAAFRFGVNVIVHALSQRAPAQTVAAGERPAAQAGALPQDAVRVHQMRRQLPCDHICAIAGDGAGVWFGGWTYLPGEDEGLARYDRRTRQFQVFMDAEGVLAEEINALMLHGGKVLIGADTWKFSRGLSVFDPDELSWQSYTREDGLPHDRIRSIAVRGDQVWLACRRGLATWNPEQDRFRHVEVPGGEHSGFLISVLVTPGGVWVNNFETVWLHDPDRGSWTDLRERTDLIAGSAAAMAACDGRVYVAPLQPRGAPVVCCDGQSGRCAALRGADALREHSITAMEAVGRPDPEADGRLRHELWVGTEKGEVFCLELPREEGDAARQVLRRRLGQGTVRCIHAVGQEVFVAVHPFGGVWRHHRVSGTWWQIRARAGVPCDHLLSLCADGETLFVGTLAAGPWRYRPADRRLTPNGLAGGWQSLNCELLQDGQKFVYLGERTAIRHSEIRDVIFDGRRVWMASNHGLTVHDPQVTPHGFEVYGPSDVPLQRLALAGDLLYCGTPDRGVRIFDVAERTWRHAAWENDEPLLAMAVWKNRLWVGTEQALYTVEDSGTALRQRARRPGGVSALLADGETLWVGRGDGLEAWTGTPQHPKRRSAAPIGRARCLVRHGGMLLVGAGDILWRVSEAPGEGQPQPFGLPGLPEGCPICDLAVTGRTLYAATSGGGLCEIDLRAPGQ